MYVKFGEFMVGMSQLHIFFLGQANSTCKFLKNLWHG